MDASTNEKIEFLWKTGTSAVENCPALYRTADGYYVQHRRVADPATRARLQSLGAANGSPLGPDEDYGFVPADVLERIREL